MKNAWIIVFLCIALTTTAWSQKIKRVEFVCNKDSLERIFFHHPTARQKVLRACRFNELNEMLGYKSRLTIYKIYKDEVLSDCELYLGKKPINIDTSSQLRIFMHADWGSFLSTELLKDGTLRVIQTSKQENRIFTYHTVKPPKLQQEEEGPVVSSLIPQKTGPYRELDLEGHLLLDGAYKLIDSISYDTVIVQAGNRYNESIQIIKNEKTSVKSGTWNTYDLQKNVIARRRYRF